MASSSSMAQLDLLVVRTLIHRPARGGAGHAIAKRIQRASEVALETWEQLSVVMAGGLRPAD